MNVKEIVIAYLKANGFDGLYNEIGECGCGCDELMPCDNAGIDDCEPAFGVYCPCCGEIVFVPVSNVIRELEKACQKSDEQTALSLSDLFGILAGDSKRSTPYAAYE